MIPSLSKTIVISTLIFTVNITSTYAGDRLPFTTSAQIVVSPTTTPYPLRTRKDYSLQFQNGGGVLITPNWAMTASHVVTWKSQKNPEKYLKIRFKGPLGKEQSRMATNVIRHPNLDIALVQLKKPINTLITPILLLNDPIKKGDGTVKIKKVYAQRGWLNIPARKGRGNNLYVSKKNRKGKAGTSGAPWVIQNPDIGDVLVAITHGSGKAPQVAFASKWIKKTVEKHTPNEPIYFANKKDVLVKKD